MPVVDDILISSELVWVPVEMSLIAEIRDKKNVTFFVTDGFFEWGPFLIEASF